MIRQGFTGTTENNCVCLALVRRLQGENITVEVGPFLHRSEASPTQNSVHRCYSDLEVRFAYSIIFTVKQLVIGRDMMSIFAALLEKNTFSDPSVTFCSCGWHETQFTTAIWLIY